ncbi:MAG: acyl-CoA dehydrogenase family protein [bacterium]
MGCLPDYTLDDEIISLRQKTAQFAREELKPYAAEWDRMADADPVAAFPMETLRRASRLGLRTLTVPKEMGGEGMGILGHCVLLEELFQGDAGFASVLHQGWKVAKTLCLYTTEAQRKEFLPRFMDDETGALGMARTEPDYGTDNFLPYTDPAGGMKFSAKRKGKGWVLNGTKHFIACGAISTVNVLVTRTNPKAPVNEGATLFLTHSDLPGFRRGHVHKKMGARLMMNAELIYENVEVPDEWRLSEVDKGYAFGRRQFGRHMPTTATFSVGVGRAAFEDAKEHARNRSAAGVPLLQDEGVRRLLADMYISISAARDVNWRAAWHADTAAGDEEYDPKEGLRAALFSSSMVQAVCNNAMSVLGGHGDATDLPFGRHLRDAMMCYHIDGMDNMNPLKLGGMLASEEAAHL